MKKMMMTLCALVLALGVSAQTTEGATEMTTMRLTLQEAIDLALSENPTIKVADLEVERYDYVRKEMLGNLYPSLSASGTYTYAVVKSEISKGLSFGADNTIAAAAEVGLPLVVPAVWRSIKMTKVQMENAVELARASRIDMVNAVKKAYYNILLAEQSLAVLRSSEATVSKTVEDTRVQYEHGLASEYNLLTAEVQLSNLQPSIIQTANSIDVAKRLLKMYLSLPENIDIALVGTLDDFRDAILNGGEQLSTDVSENSTLKQLDIQAELLRQNLKLTQTSRMPTLAAFGQFAYSGNDMQRPDFSAMMGGGATGGTTGSTGNAGTAEAVKKSFYWQHPISIGVSLSVPIFSGFKNTNKVRQVRNQIRQLELQRDYVAKSTDVQVRSSINNLLTAREKMFANEKTVAQAQKAYDISNTRYKAGAGTILELNTAELSLTQAKLNYSQAIYDYISAKADYDQIVGKEE
ncbi:MAG: TolC family protein [Rikenellaceae bacterium]|nr:TolC family protein [Rikenellaceae bacterium]MBQ3254230.1 TolC family protein [Rikenellaceae bacterium]MBQ9147232.1 TolC family protein [Rikenellaceae bacterium]MBR4055265.1 TolC family protein [Rikenellaceae bacterium]